MRSFLTAIAVLFAVALASGQGARRATSAQGKPAAPAAQASPRENAPIVTARFTPDSIGLGDTFRLRLEVTKDIMQQIGWPEGEQKDGIVKFTEHIEVVEDRAQDTVRTEGRRVTIGKEWVLQTFTAGTHGLKHIPVLWVDKNIVDTIYARPDSIMIQVGTFEIDTLTMDIHDIKPLLQTPVRFGEFSGYLFGGLGLLALIAVAVWLILKWRKNKAPFWKRRADEPPHLAAIRALEALQHQKLWQNNKHKQYYTLLADIVRTYIEGRYGVQAMEMTTDELMAAVAGLGFAERNRTQLRSLLSTADLAKFAKYAPPAEDNEGCYNDAYYFVEDTKPVEVETEMEDEK
ncbi:MAG: hypothetical protein LBU95_00485 [Rikenellaceae bacterium]|jgi:hypothetical protein|nr:hypothetical protein [Rikenellaceae bacterium]